MEKPEQDQKLTKPVSEQNPQEYWNQRFKDSVRVLGKYVDARPDTRYEYPPEDGVRDILLQYGLSDEEMKTLAQRFREDKGKNKRIKGRKFPLSESFLQALVSVFGDQGRQEDTEDIKNSQ